MHSYLQSPVGPPPAQATFEHLQETDKRLRELSARLEAKLGPLLRPGGPVPAGCAPSLAVCAVPCRSDVSQVVHELNVTMNVISNVIDRIDL
jgi:hypothetical protein